MKIEYKNVILGKVRCGKKNCGRDYRVSTGFWKYFFPNFSWPFPHYDTPRRRPKKPADWGFSFLFFFFYLSDIMWYKLLLFSNFSVNFFFDFFLTSWPTWKIPTLLDLSWLPYLVDNLNYYQFYLKNWRYAVQWKAILNNSWSRGRLIFIQFTSGS